jgi:hypothetical protein
MPRPGQAAPPPAQYRGAQRLVALRGVRQRDDQVGLIRFFLRASARSRLRRCTLIPNRVSIAPTHCEVVRAGLAVLRSATKATTSVEILWPVCTGNPIRVNDVTESPKLAE